MTTTAKRRWPHARRIQQFLRELANLARDPLSLAQFLNRFADFELLNERVCGPLKERFADAGLCSADDNEALEQLLLLYLRQLARGMWRAVDVRDRYEGWFILRSDLARNDRFYLDLSNWWTDDSLRVRLPPPRSPLPVEHAFEYLLVNGTLAFYCQNESCKAPYYFAQRHTQRYCSADCAAEGKRETKRRWWAAHGAEWSEGRKRGKKVKTIIGSPEIRSQKAH